MPTLRDPLWNNIRVDGPYLPLMDSAPFQRLRYVRQLGLAHLVYPGATHSRFEHALGAYHLARLTVRVLADAGELESVSDLDRRLVVAAALLHDIGHLLTVEDEEGGHRPAEDRRHETAGALYLGRWFGPEVTRPVALHVAAKRYLCAVEAQYFAALSPGSVHSLALQGGPMSDAQCDAFRSANGWEGALALRRWDDRAKRPGATVPSLSSYHGLLAGLVVV